MAKSKFNHKRRIQDLQPAKARMLFPGTIVQFRYKGKGVFDKQPLVLVLWNDYRNYKIHGINLNYITEFKIKRLFKEIMEFRGNILVVEDQAADGVGDNNPEDDDDTLPFRNMLKDPYTRIKLPTYKEDRPTPGNNPMSYSEAKIQMNMLYEKVKEHGSI